MQSNANKTELAPQLLHVCFAIRILTEVLPARSYSKIILVDNVIIY